VTLLAALSALGAMTVFGIAAVLQGVATARAGDVGVLDPRLLLRLARQPLFLLALVLNGVGFLLHVAALQSLPLFLVQAVIAGSVGVTAVLSVRVLRVPLSRAQWGAVGLVVVGLALLALSAGASESLPAAPGAAGVLLAIVAAVLVLAVAVRRAPSAIAPVLLGLLAGAGFGVVAIAARLLPELGLGVLRSPLAGVLVLAGASAFFVYSAAMQRGSVTTATASMVLTQTVVPAVAGLLLGDQVRPGYAPLAAVGFALALAGALGLGRFESGPLVPVEPPLRG
jgi:drug/metabolite transporter (DMT)-like permease